MVPPWEILKLVAHYLDPKTLAISSCVSKSWLVSMSSDQIWQPICKTHYPSFSNLKTTHPSLSYRRLYAIGFSASKRRLKPPSTPRISLHDLIFALDLRTKNNNLPFLIIAKPANEFCLDPNGMFSFDIKVEEDCDHQGLEVGELELELEEEVMKITWNVVLRGWRGAFTVMNCEGKVSLVPGARGWFSEELPSAGCCCGEVGSGIVGDLKLEYFHRGGKNRVEKVSVGILSIVNWRYVSVDDGLRYLQHFLLPSCF